MTYKEQIRLILDANGWKPADFARSMGTTGATVSRWMNNGPKPSGASMTAINLMYESIINRNQNKVTIALDGLSKDALITLTEEANRTGRPVQDLAVEAVERLYSPLPKNPIDS